MAIIYDAFCIRESLSGDYRKYNGGIFILNFGEEIELGKLPRGNKVSM